MDTEVKTQKWTPGKWFIFKNSPIFGGCDVIFSEHIEDAIICSMGHDVREVEGNALLISKSPEMADLLRRAHVELGSEHGTETSPHCACPLCSEIEALLSTLGKI